MGNSNGRLFRYVGHLARTVAYACALILVSAHGSFVHAEDVECPQYAAAKADCLRSQASEGARYGVKRSCWLEPAPSASGSWNWQSERNGSYRFAFGCTESCASRKNINLMTDRGTDFSQSAGAYGCHAGCRYALTDAKSDGLHTWGVGVTTGQFCGAQVIPEDEGVPPPPCDGQPSCYDPGKGYCATLSSGMVCVPGTPPADGGPNCAVSGDAAVCAGKPKDPDPPDPPNPPIKDPEKDRKPENDGKYDTPQGVVVVGGWQSGGSGGNGGDPGTDPGTGDPGDGSDPGTDPGTGDPGDGDDEPDEPTASGGETCAAPPQCSGDAPTCMAATQAWRLRCSVSKDDKNGNGQPDWTEVTKADSDKYATTETPRSAVFSSETVDASKIDSKGWLGATCPTPPSKTVLGASFGVDVDFFCKWLGLIRAATLLAAAVAAVIIMAGGKD